MFTFFSLSFCFHFRIVAHQLPDAPPPLDDPPLSDELLDELDDELPLSLDELL